ncbi:MAG: cyclic nucleotide-binding domain-containing protein [Pseudomonadota bacterium]
MNTLFAQQSDWFVHAAAGLYVVAFLIRDQMWLRAIVLVGTIFYIGYYYLAPETPLWAAIWWSLALMVANLVSFLRLALDRTTFAMSDSERRVYTSLGRLRPGEFRKLSAIAQWRDLDAPLVLTKEGEANTQLHFIASGSCTLTKKGRTLHHAAPGFIGEVAYLLGRKASATARAEAGSKLVSWDQTALNKLLKRNPAIRVALHDILNLDMANKVAAS